MYACGHVGGGDRVPGGWSVGAGARHMCIQIELPGDDATCWMLDEQKEHYDALVGGGKDCGKSNDLRSCCVPSR
jgi:hypothetical protein